MAIALNHTIVYAHDARVSAEFLVELFDLPAPVPYYRFLDVELGNGVTLAYMSVGKATIEPQHYAFLVSEADFDRIFDKIVARGLPHWADPHHRQRGINRNDGGRGVYFDDPAGHALEIITRPYAPAG